MKKSNGKKISRSRFLKNSMRIALGLGAGVLSGYAVTRSYTGDTRWQIDPNTCIQCGRCATNCVLTPSAVKCVHAFAVCGYCDLCSGYYHQDRIALDTAAENRLCPTSAIKRTFIEDPYYEYVIDQTLCIGCGKCVKGCLSFGNGSLFLQVMHDRCVNCNDCSIAKFCPSHSFKRVPASAPYLLKGNRESL